MLWACLLEPSDPELSTMVLIDVVTYEVAVGASIFMVEVADEDRHQ
jgi:hypothetical protein